MGVPPHRRGKRRDPICGLVARLMILVQHPQHVSSDEAEAWLQAELQAIGGPGVLRVQLKRLGSPSLRFSETWTWMVEIDCRDVEAARDAVQQGGGRAFLADLRMLGMRPSVALVEDIC